MKTISFKMKIGILFAACYLFFTCIAFVFSFFAVHKGLFNNLIILPSLPWGIVLIWSPKFYPFIALFTYLINAIILYGLGYLIAKLFDKTKHKIIILKTIMGIVILVTLSITIWLVSFFVSYDPGRMRTMYFDLNTHEKSIEKCYEIATTKHMPSFAGRGSRFLTCELDVDQTLKDTYAVIPKKSKNNIYDCACSHEMEAMF